MPHRQCRSDGQRLIVTTINELRETKRDSGTGDSDERRKHNKSSRHMTARTRLAYHAIADAFDVRI